MLFKIKSRYDSFKRRIGFIPYKGIRKVDLLIYDNVFPHPISGYRYEEFIVLLDRIVKSKIVLNPTSYKLIGTPIHKHREHITSLEKEKPNLKGKLISSKEFVNVNTKLFYCLFFKSISANLNWLEKYKIPFVFTLYPGGGFQVNNEAKNKKIKRICNSPMFRKVIVTQLFTKQYLVENNLCEEKNIEYIFGCVVPQVSIEKKIEGKAYYLKNKTTFDVCFCSAKYMPKGTDKGYDVFIDFAKKISKQFDFIRFHIIGGFSEEDINVDDIKDKILFYGYKDFNALSGIFENMDVMVSPNKPFVLHEGSFDGFPLGTAVEAALNGVVVLASDNLNQNNVFVPDEEIIIIESTSDAIVEEVSDLINNPEKLYYISNKGKEKFAKVYSNETQMTSRTSLLIEEISKS